MDEGPQLVWVQAQNGCVPRGAIAAGREAGKDIDVAATYVGRLTIKDEKFVGRVVPSYAFCYAIHMAMEHSRANYEVLVNATPERLLLWRKEYDGHVPDGAVALPAGDMAGGETCYVGRAVFGADLVVPGYIVPSHGVIHAGYENRDSIKEEYDVLCVNAPCSLRYLAAKKIRDSVRASERIRNAKYSTKISNVIFSLERLLFTVLRKPAPRRETTEEKLELPACLVSYLRKPKQPHALKHLDFNSIMENSCAPEELCCCQMWVDVTLQGLY